MKAAERFRARQLRQVQGWSIKRIASALDVSPSSVSRWVSDIELTEDQLEKLRRANPIFQRQRRGSERRRLTARLTRERYQQAGREQARCSDPLHLTGCMLYWAEGSKDRNAVGFVNSDVAMMTVFLRFLRSCYGVQDEQVTFRCNCFLNNGLTLSAIESWWLGRLRLPRASLRRAIVNRPPASSSRQKRTLPYGTGHLRIYSTEIVQGIFGAIQEYAGIDRPEWLDCR